MVWTLYFGDQRLFHGEQEVSAKSMAAAFETPQLFSGQNRESVFLVDCWVVVSGVPVEFIALVGRQQAVVADST